MARTSIPVVTPIGPYPTLPVTALAADVAQNALTGSSGASGNQAAFGNFNRLLLVFQNTDATSKTVTITSLASGNVFNRTGDISAYAIAAGLMSAFFIERNGWIQSDGNLYFEATSALMKVTIFGIS